MTTLLALTLAVAIGLAVFTLIWATVMHNPHRALPGDPTPVNAEPHTHELTVERWSDSLCLTYGTSEKWLHGWGRFSAWRIRLAAGRLKREHDRGSARAGRQNSEIARATELARRDLVKRGWRE